MAQHLQMMAPTSSAATSAPPTSLRLIGREENRANADINGEYCFKRMHGGFPVYQNRKSGTVIRAFQGRWCVDRSGIRDCAVCVAYAMQIRGRGHPADPELVWHVYDDRAQRHDEDPQVFTIDAPATLSFVGRGADRENSVVNGKYSLVGIMNSRACYRKGEMYLSMNKDFRWNISDCTNSNVSTAWAEPVDGSVHPGDLPLKWHFWEADNFVHDPSTGVLSSPAEVNILGRDPDSVNANITGTYELMGMHEGRPYYARRDTGAVIRYSAQNSWWMIDCDGSSSKPGMLERTLQWIWSGDRDDAYNRCNAFAHAQNTLHPGSLDLKWYVWETSSGRHLMDQNVVSTSCPLNVEVSGRAAARENSDINGLYVFVGQHQGFPLYQKPKSTTCIYYYPREHRWVIDRHGIRNKGACVAYTDAGGNPQEGPTKLGTWFVWESTRGRFLRDGSVQLTVPKIAEAPIMQMAAPGLTLEDQMSMSIGGAPVMPVGRGLKRGMCLESDGGWSAQMPQQFAEMPAPKFHRAAPQANPQGQGRGWLSFLGGS